MLGAWDDVRSLWDLDEGVAHLNHGSFGAVPREVLAMRVQIQREVERNPNGFYGRELLGRYEAARVAAAEFLGAEDDGVALVDNVTTGINAILSGLDLGPDDEVLITDHAYGAVRLAARETCTRTGASLRVQPVPFPQTSDDLFTGVLSGVTSRTRLAVVDQVASETALAFPVDRIAAALRDRGVLTLVDGAHAPGMVPVDLRSLDPDFWAGTFHKWGAAPRGAAAVFVGRAHRERATPLIVSHGVDRGYPRSWAWTGTRDYSALLCIPTALSFLDRLGLDRLRRHNRDLVLAGRDAVAAGLGTSRAYPDDVAAGVSMSLVPLPDAVELGIEDVQDLVTRIAVELRAEVTMSLWSGRPYLRLSAQAYNRLDEYERLGRELPRLLEEIRAPR